jgi:phosphoribosylanthranilate isomerase
VRPLVKICGLKRVEDAELAVSLGADLIGCVRTPSSPRRVSLDEARALFEAAGSSAARVLVFQDWRDCALDAVLSDARAAGADWVQIYDASDSDVRRAEQAGLGVLRVYGMSERARALPAFAVEPSADRPALLDVGGGGSGRSFDWALLGAEAPAFTFVAGGIRPENVEALFEHHPYGIDLSSGVEREPGVKDGGKLRALFEKIEERTG